MRGGLAAWIVAFVLYSAVGWAWECVYCSLHERRPVNRGFLNGPWCPIYGAGACLDAMLFSGVRNPVALFLAGAVACSCLEYATSWAMEAAFHARWWDYSHRRLNLHGRVCAAGACLFGAGTIAICLFVQPALDDALASWPPLLLAPVATLLAVAMACDLAVTLLGLSGFRTMASRLGAQLAETLQEHLPDASALSAAQDWLGQVADLGDTGRRLLDAVRELGADVARSRQAEELRRGLRRVLTSQERRVLDAFPNLRATYARDLARVARERLRDLVGR